MHSHKAGVTTIQSLVSSYISNLGKESLTNLKTLERLDSKLMCVEVLNPQSGLFAFQTEVLHWTTFSWLGVGTNFGGTNFCVVKRRTQCSVQNVLIWMETVRWRLIAVVATHIFLVWFWQYFKTCLLLEEKMRFCDTWNHRATVRAGYNC